MRKIARALISVSDKTGVADFASGLAALGALMANRFQTHMVETRPPAVRQALPPDRLAGLTTNPQALMSPDALSQVQGLFAQMGPAGADLPHLVEAETLDHLAAAVGNLRLGNDDPDAVNVGMMIGLLPVTGIPLPLMSQGGSSVLSTFLGLGLAMSVRMRRLVY